MAIEAAFMVPHPPLDVEGQKRSEKIPLLYQELKE